MDLEGSDPEVQKGRFRISSEIQGSPGANLPRSVAHEQEDIFDSVREGISSLFRDERSPEVKLLARRDRKRRGVRNHRNAYLVVNGGLGTLNLIIGLVMGWTFPWALFPAVFWGMGLSLHALAYRNWARDHADAIADAERKLGRLPPGQAYKSLPAPKDAPVVEGVTIRDREWIQILAKAEQAIARAREALDDVDQNAATTEEIRVQLENGLANIEQLAAGAERISEALAEIAPDGPSGLDQEIGEVDRKINAADDEQLEEVFLANRSMLIARKKKLEALDGERARMKANAEGFLIATENVRLDVAGLGSDEAPKAKALTEPAQRLTEEVEILRKVEAELKQFM